MASPTAPVQQTATKLILDITKVGGIDSVIDCIDSMVDVSTDFRRILDDLKSEVEQFYIQPLIHDLQYYPPKVPRKINWTSDKQRKYVMKLLRDIAIEEGRDPDDIAYRRTYKLRDGWKHEVLLSGGQKGYLRIRVWNDAENDRARPGRDDKHYAKYVVGGLGVGKSDSATRRYRKPMQQFHREGGWREAQPLTLNAFEMAEVYVNREYNRRINELLLYACM